MPDCTVVVPVPSWLKVTPIVLVPVPPDLVRLLSLMKVPPLGEPPLLLTDASVANVKLPRLVVEGGTTGEVQPLAVGVSR